MSTNKKKSPSLGIAFDLGSGFSAVDLASAAGVTAAESPIDGTQVPTIVFRDEKNDKWFVGREALMHHCSSAHEGLLIHHPKRNIPRHARDLIYGGKYSPIEILTQVLIYLKKIALSCYPELADYPQFGGSKKTSDELGLVFTTPASWGIEEHAAFEEAILSAGFTEFDGFIAEPVAAARHVARTNSTRINNGDKILVADVGAGTSDISVLEFRQGVYHQCAAASGDGYLAGADFTAALAAAIAEQHGVQWDGAYSEGGLNLSDVIPADRQAVLACWNSAEEAKKMLSVLDDATVAVDLSDGRKTYTVGREEAARLLLPLIERFGKCVAASLDATKLSFSDINHFMLVGGASPTPGLRDAMARAIGRDATDILVCTKSEHVIAAGAAEHALYQDEASQALETGLGFTVVDTSSSQRRHLLLIEPGHILPPEGYYFELNGFAIDSTGGCKSIVCRPFVCRNGVRATVAPERRTFLEASEVANLEVIDSPLEGFPDGVHDISLGIKADPNRNLWLLARPIGLAGVEPLSIRLKLQAPKGSKVENSQPVCVVAMDVSWSMRRQKLALLKEGVNKLLQEAHNRGIPVAVLAYGKLKAAAKLIARFEDPLAIKQQAVEALSAGGTTPMHKGLDLALETLCQLGSNTNGIVAMFTDGMPDCPDTAATAAERLKKDACLVTVGIGEDVVEPYLRQLASSPAHYCYASAPDDIFGAVERVAELVWNHAASANGAT